MATRTPHYSQTYCKASKLCRCVVGHDCLPHNYVQQKQTRKHNYISICTLALGYTTKVSLCEWMIRLVRVNTFANKKARMGELLLIAK